MSASASLTIALPRFVRAGHVRLPVFGLIATAGLIAAMSLSRRTARVAGLDPERVWDAGIVAIVSAFAVSRLLLVVANLRLFGSQPLLVLGYPSLTPGALVLAASITLLWLRHRGMPLLRVADAWAAPALLLLAALQMAHFAEGTDAGMPTTLPWGVSSFALGRVHPVQLYAATGYLALCVQRLRIPRNAAACALMLGGCFSFLVDFFRQPLSSGWLDPAQYAALFMALLGVGILMRFYVPPPELTREEAATILEEFALGTAKRGFAHEAIEYGRFKDPLLVEVQGIVSEMFGPMDNEQIAIMLAQAQRLRASHAPESEVI